MPKEFLVPLIKPLTRLTLALSCLCLSCATLSAEVDQGEPQAGRTSVRKGDTLDRLIARQWKDHPFRLEVLRRLVVQKNPQAFRAGRADQLIAGASLAWPGPQELQGLLPATAAESGAEVEASEQAVSQSADPRSGWIRYP